ncbi:MAG: pyridoxamine 5'-phosphate oxidase family protein [Rikenellaceae bacterium]
MESKIVKFIDKHHVMTLATQSDQGVYCANAFYAFDSESGSLIFSSGVDTRHGSEMTANRQVAASIVLETKIVGKIQGAQIIGNIEESSSADKTLYISKFPYAAVVDLQLWRLRIDHLKLTDNTLGFGKKLIWNRA